MSSKAKKEIKYHLNSSNNNINNANEEISNDDNDNNIKFIRRTIENNTHEVIEDTKIKNITSWRKSEKKFYQILVFNILSFGILHIISLFLPKLYLKLYCNQRPCKECDFFLIEDIYGELTLCKNIHKQSNTNYYDSESTRNNMSTSSLLNSNNRIEFSFAKHLTYSFKYKSVTYEYQDETNEIIPVYMNISKMTNRGIFNHFSEGLSTESSVKKYQERYGKNEYYINLNIPHFYFQRIEKKYFIIVILFKLLDLASKDYMSMVSSFLIILIIVGVEIFLGKKVINRIYKNEFTLDGEQKKIKVKRRYKFLNDHNFYCEIKNCELLPGDIIFLKSNDFVPCDCIILEGDCLVNENNLTGSLDISKKTSLKSNNEQFSYKLNKVSILYHGTKIVDICSKLKGGFISALCINIGPNTYKANLFSNILYLFERKIEYKKMYEPFGEGRQSVFVIIILVLLFSILFFFSYAYFMKIFNGSEKKLIIKDSLISLAKIVCRSSMPVYFLTYSVINITSIMHLKNENIICFDKSKLISASAINTIFFSKTGTLCEINFEIKSYHPIYITTQKSNNIRYKTYKAEQFKEMNLQLLNFYKEYMCKTQIYNNQIFNVRHPFRGDIKKLSCNIITKETFKFSCLFLECLLSCNNLEKYNNEIFGNPIEKSIFMNLRWNIKPYDYNNDNNDKNVNSNISYSNPFDNNKTVYDKYLNLIDRNIKDIYPNNYFKITESIKNEIKESNISKYYIEKINSSAKKDNRKSVLNPSLINSSNYVKYDIYESDVKTYKLRIYKRFIKNGTLNSSAITYNFITKELRFMTKGMPEDIINKCDISTLPNNFEKILYYYRKMGLIIIICATKIINIEEYDDMSSIDEYMRDLTFCGFMTLKNNLKKEVFNSIKDIKQFNCKLIISTGDNVYNTLSVGFESNILENKNIFCFDRDNKNRIIITKLYDVKKIYENDDDKDESVIYSVQTSKFLSLQSSNIRPKPRKSRILYLNLNEHSSQKTDNNESNYEGSNRKRPIQRNKKVSKNIIECNKIFESEEDENNLSPIYNYGNEKKMETKIKDYCKESNPSSYYLKESKNIQQTNTNKRISQTNCLLEKYYFYPNIFEEHEDLANNCIYCISGQLFNYLYDNKDKKKYKKLLERIHKFTNIFYSMTSLQKSLVIDYYREYKDNCICTIGECQSDHDAIITSNIGINLKSPKNRNTILCHFYSVDSSILSLKKIIREGRTVNENILLLAISCGFYSIILNSYIICCFIRRIDAVNVHLDFLELNFFIISMTAFTAQYDDTKSSNPLINNKKLYKSHYIAQIIGIFIIKLLSIYFQSHYLIGNNAALTKEEVDKIFCSYYFIFCIEQLFSTVFLFNLIFFYRKNPFTNVFFLFFNLLQFSYCMILLTIFLI